MFHIFPRSDSTSSLYAEMTSYTELRPPQDGADDGRPDVAVGNKEAEKVRATKPHLSASSMCGATEQNQPLESTLIYCESVQYAP